MSQTDLKTSRAVVLAETSLSLGDLLHGLHRRGRLLPLLRQAILEQFLVDEAKAAGLTVAAEELQRAADIFRRRHGLTSAAQTNAWLQRQRLSITDFEDALERDLLIAKLKDHVTKERLGDHFTAHRARYDRVTLSQILVAREDLARELLTQIRDEGADFADLARRHSMDGSRVKGGALGTRLRRQLPEPVAEAVFATAHGNVAGPVATPQGFHLFCVEAAQPATLDEPTTALVREEVFAAWLNERLSRTPMTFPLLDELPLSKAW